MEHQSIQFVRWQSDGTVAVRINGVEYTYIIDAAHIKRLQNLARFAPFKALNQIKKMDQTPVKEPIPQRPPVQKTLF